MCVSVRLSVCPSVSMCLSDFHFVNDNPVYDVAGASYTFSKRFVDYFLECFNHEVHKNGLDDLVEPESPTEVFGPDDWDAIAAVSKRELRLKWLYVVDSSKDSRMNLMPVITPTNPTIPNSVVQHLVE
ncbi:hypothetical protein QZH41_004545, partial [Actinostola sp. cb2023]